MVSPVRNVVPTPLTQNRQRKDWTKDAKCIPYPALFTSSETNSATDSCKSICRACPVVAECLGYALAHDVEGIWAGTNSNQRAKMKVNRPLLLSVVPIEPPLSEYLKEDSLPIVKEVRLIQKSKLVSFPTAEVAPVVIEKKPVQGIQWDDLDRVLRELQSFS